MGVSPYYRGAACNFWALYDNNADLVGATIHKLSRGLDDGDILFHAFPRPIATEPFLLGMRAVKAAHNGLVEYLANGQLKRLKAEKQDKTQEIRYTENRQFTDEIASQYLARKLGAADVETMLSRASNRHLTSPYYDL